MLVDFDRLQEALAGRYTLERELGQGGMAVVYLAVDPKHNRQVALKVLLPELAATVGPKRFLREIEIAAGLNHPHVLPLHDSGEADGFLYYVMPYVEGESLGDRLVRDGPLPLDEALRYARDVAEGLDYAHSRGVVHRDIKPANILLSEGHALIADFGVARALSDANEDRMTSTGLTVGSIAYMSPEQAAGERDFDGRSDLYSLGCVLYEMLCGEQPFTGETSRAVLLSHLNKSPDSLASRGVNVPAPVEDALLGLMAKDPQDRWSAGNVFVDALADGLVGGAPGSGLSGSGLGSRLAGWNRPLSFGVAAAVVALLAMSLRSWAPWTQRGPALDPTRIAVLYFDDLSLEQDLAYLADGLTESLINALGQIQPLQVVSRNGVKPYRDNPIPIDSLARILAVGSLVEGSVERSEGQLIATVQLVDGTTQTQSFSERIVRGGNDILALRDDIVKEATRLLGQQLGRELQLREVREGTASSEAWQAFRRATRLLEDADTLRWGLGDNESASRVLGQADSILALAESLDSDWMEPVVERGWVAWTLASFTGSRARRDEATIRRGISHADRVLDRNPDDATAVELRGVLRNELSWLNSIAADSTAVRALRQGAEADLRAAVAADPSRARAWVALADLLRVGGDFGEASLVAQRAVDADPFLINAEKEILVTLGQVWLDLGDLDRAESWTEAGRRRYPAELAFPATALVILSGWDGAEPDVEMAWDLSATLRGWLNGELLVAGVLARAGLADSARAVVDRVRPQVGDDPWARYYEANTRIQLGEPARAVVLLDEFLELMPDRKAYIANDWWWKALAENEDFRALIATESQ